MDRRALALALSLVVILGVIPSVALSLFLGVDMHENKTIVWASAEAPGQGMSVAAHITDYNNAQKVYQESYENKLESSESVERVITERLNRLEGVSEERGDAYGNLMARQALQNGMSGLTDAVVSETVEAASVETDEETIRVAVEQTSITDVRGEVHLEFEGDRIFLATESEDGEKSYRGSVSAANGQFGDLDPEKFKGSTPIDALRTACGEITAEEWDRSKEQFAQVIQDEFGTKRKIIDLSSKDVVCSTIKNGGDGSSVPS